MSINITASAANVILYIDENLTPEQFDKVCQDFPDYNLKDGHRGLGTALMRSCEVGSLELVKHIVKKNLDLINQQNSHGETPLSLAIASGYTAKSDHKTRIKAFKKVKFLLALGANPNTYASLMTTNEKYTPLFYLIHSFLVNAQIENKDRQNYFNQISKLLILYDAKALADPETKNEILKNDPKSTRELNEVEEKAQEISQAIVDDIWPKARLLLIANNDANASLSNMPIDIINNVFKQIHQQYADEIDFA